MQPKSIAQIAVGILLLILIYFTYGRQLYTEKEVDAAFAEQEKILEEKANLTAELQQKPEPDWNYMGNIGGIPIKAYLKFEDNTGGVGLWHPVSGYYFYASKRIKIKLDGSWHAGGIGIKMTEYGDSGKTANFEGEDIYQKNTWEEITGTWTGHGKALNFALYKK